MRPNVRPAALKKDEASVLTHAHQLAEAYSQSNGGSIDVSDWFFYFSMDVMGDLAFANDLAMKSGLEDSKPLRILRDGMHILGPLTPVPWLAQLAFSLPGAAAAWMSLIGWCTEMMQERLERDLGKNDVGLRLFDQLRKNIWSWN